MENINIDRCYKVCLDNKDITNLSAFFNSLITLGDITYFEDEIYIWLYSNVNKKSLLSKIKKNKINNFFCKQIDLKDIEGRKDFLSTWFLEHYNKYVVEEFEAKNQEMLKLAQDNIRRASKEFDDIIEKIKNKKEAVDGK